LSVLNDDVITYGLSLRVENTDLTGSVPAITPAALAGIPITVNGTLGTPNTTRILVSDAIPLNTVPNAAPTPPPGWVVVYSTDDPITVTANAAAWTTTAPAALGSVRRVGFINDPNVFTSVAPGATVTGFNIQVRTTVTPAVPTTIYNIAQVAGTTSGNNDPATNKIYDNSGDQNPDNFAGGTFPTTQDSGYTATPATNLDNQNNNTGTNSAIGNFNPFTISVPNALSILNGPNGTPAAVGPTDNNNDFTNKSALIGPNIPPGTPIDPAPVSFTNTVVNNGTTAGNIALIPTPPTVADDLPDGTVVTISYQNTSAAYTYNRATGFTYVAGSGVGNAANGNPISATNPVSIPAAAVPINSGANANYGVSVDLPPGTPLSTDTTAQGAPVTTTIQRGFPVPITAFLDVNNNGAIDPDPLEEPRNITIDRVYTGFLQLLKESRILQGTGAAVQGTDGTFSIGPKRPAPGNIIEYRITYKNISESISGTGNVILNADNVVITEDGTAGTNNWAIDNPPTNGVIDTSNVVGSAKDSGASTITFFNGIPAVLGSDITGLTAATDVTKYVNTVTGVVPPQTTRTFTFQRKLN
ncbi:MAG: hypothetical protein ACK47G_04110, partial [Pseudanabaena sp.]